MTSTSDLVVEHRLERESIVVTPSGQLDVSTYRLLRDALLKCAAEGPAAIVVELGDLDVDRVSSLSVFPTVWMRTAVWPEVPLLLAGARGSLARSLAASAVPRFVPCHLETAEALDAVGRPPPRRRAEIELPALTASSRTARRWVAERLEHFGIPACEAAVLVACELVENALVHTGSGCRLRLELHPAGLSVAVSDNDARPPRLCNREARDPGYGLALIEMFARAWGHSPRWGGGKVVWAVLAVPGGPDGPIDPPRPLSPDGPTTTE